MKILLQLLLLCGVMSTTLLAHPDEKFSRVRIFVSDRSSLERIWSTGIDHEGVTGKIGDWMEFVAGDHELMELTAQGIVYSVVVDDLAAYYESQLAPGPVDALGFGFGSMGGFYTFAEVVQQLDSMRAQYPHLISVRDSVGTSIESRPIWAVKISDNPDVNETEEHEVLYTALHHAREPQGMMTLMYYMWWLLENYGTDPDATYLVDTRQLWFISVVNPDGYVHNQTTNPSGGGMWRKNRRNNGGSFGVDPNRNYGPYYMWNASNGGSSTTANSETYRGTAPFSEPENQAIDSFMRVRNIRTCLNYHTWGNYLIYPYGYLSKENADSLIYRDWTYDMTFIGRYTNGTDRQTVNYSTRGNSDDYMYGDTTKPVTYTMTPEVGITGFWPSSSLILPLAIENLNSNKLLAYFAGHYPKFRGHRILEADSNGSITAGEPFVLEARIRNIGLSSATDLEVTAQPSVSWVQFTSSTDVLALLPPQSETYATFSGVAAQDAPVSAPFSVYLTFSDKEGFLKHDTVKMFLGHPVKLFEDKASGGTGNWSTGQGWGVTTNAYSLPNAFTDSPSGNYASSANNSLALLNSVSLEGYAYAQLRFQTKWAVEPTWDFATVDVSTNNGAIWTNLRCELSRPGSARSGSQQPAGSWGFDSYTPGLNWIEQTADLTPYAGLPIKIRFRVAADAGEQRDGFYVDDIRIIAYSLTPPPGPPLLVSPPDMATGQPTSLRLKWMVSPGASSYRLQVAEDSVFALILLDQAGIADTSKWVTSLTDSSTYYWRVQATGLLGTGEYSPAYRFSTSEGGTQMYQMAASWNSFSLPLTVSDASVGTLLPDASSAAYMFLGSVGYRAVDTLRPGVGYWVKFDAPTTVVIAGINRFADTVYVTSGWNYIGSLSDEVVVDSIVQIPSGLLESPFYGYDNIYSAVDVLLPARSYWVKAGESGMLILTAGQQLKPAGKTEEGEMIQQRKGW